MRRRRGASSVLGRHFGVDHPFELGYLGPARRVVQSELCSEQRRHPGRGLDGGAVSAGARAVLAGRVGQPAGAGATPRGPRAAAAEQQRADVGGYQT